MAEEFASAPRFTTTSGGMSTSDDAAITLLTVPAGATYFNLLVVNGSGIAGWVSWDGGASWLPWLPNQQTLSLRAKLTAGVSVQFKRIAGGTNVTGLLAVAT